ncbi:MAG: photosystem II protein Y [Cyanobacteria bacterium QS_8_64_29]|nr:MAG: photosystem II protein Y [Cyanobacteria bacterium QS_8_64_29]
MDWRVLIVFLPILVAAGWALYNIGAAALQQARNFLSEES